MNYYEIIFIIYTIHIHAYINDDIVYICWKDVKRAEHNIDSISKQSGKLLVQKGTPMYTKWYSGDHPRPSTLCVVFSLCVYPPIHISSL